MVLGTCTAFRSCGVRPREEAIRIQPEPIPVSDLVRRLFNLSLRASNTLVFNLLGFVRFPSGRLESLIMLGGTLQHRYLGQGPVYERATRCAPFAACVGLLILMKMSGQYIGSLVT